VYRGDGNVKEGGEKERANLRKLTHTQPFRGSCVFLECPVNDASLCDGLPRSGRRDERI